MDKDQNDREWSYFHVSQDELLLDNTLPTGQTFRWNKMESGHYIGVLEKRVVQLVQSKDELHYRVLGKADDAEGDTQLILWDYFNLDIELEDLSQQWAKKDQRFKALQQYIPGARMLRQDPLECLLSFLCSQNNNISRIKGMIDKLCFTYGQEIPIDYESLLEDYESYYQMEIFKEQQLQAQQNKDQEQNGVPQNGFVNQNGGQPHYDPTASTEDSRYMDFMGVRGRFSQAGDQQLRRSMRKRRDFGAFQEMGEIDSEVRVERTEVMQRHMTQQAENGTGQQQQTVQVMEQKLKKPRRRKSDPNGVVKRTKRYSKNINNYFTQNGDYMKFYTFPNIEELMQASEQELRDLKFGYRAKYIQQTCDILYKKEGGGNQWLQNLRALNYRDAQLLLMQFPGIGQKVASCICLFSLEKHQAVPIDTHVWEIAKKYYLPQLQGKTLTGKIMTQVEDKLIESFGPFAGWAHNTLFVAELDSHIHLLPPNLVTKAKKAQRNQKSLTKNDKADQIIEDRLQEKTIDSQLFVQESSVNKRKKQQS